MSTTETTPAKETLTEEGVHFFVDNTKRILGFLVNNSVFRHEGEANRLLLAVENITKDIEEVLRSAEPVSPTAGGVDPMLQAVMKQNEDLTSKVNELLDAINSGKLVPAAPAVTPPAETPVSPPVENATTSSLGSALGATTSSLGSALGTATTEPVAPPETGLQGQ